MQDHEEKKQPEQHDGRSPGRSIVLGAVLGAGGVVVAAVVVALVVAYGGLYNVAATEQHTAFGRWVLDTTFENSVKGQAGGVGPAPQVTPAMLRAGATAYKSMCEHCHGGPGVERAEWASGMRPRPPHLVEAAADWSPAEVFWIAKHGIRMSGMPAFGPTHDDATLWSVAAFVKALPGMEPGRYAALGEASAGHEAGSSE